MQCTDSDINLGLLAYDFETKFSIGSWTVRC